MEDNEAMESGKIKRVIDFLRWMERSKDFDHKCTECDARVHPNYDSMCKPWSIIGHDRSCNIAIALDNLNEKVLWKIKND